MHFMLGACACLIYANIAEKSKYSSKNGQYCNKDANVTA